ncbi:MAG: DUF805 domain-containing protein [Alphaproteobacteria bacterium]|nr:DUF805 domain-containing protein [Alphaproteobacteria bacterium]
MLMKDKDILSSEKPSTDEKREIKPKKPRISKEDMRTAWGDAFDYYLRGITEKYLNFHGRASRLEFWGFMVASGIVFFPLYGLSIYVDMPMLVYYYYLATLIPTIGVMVRRFHDINKKASIYLLSGVIIGLSSLFIGIYSIILLLLWGAMIVKLLLIETDISEGLFGAANESDEIYGESNILIIRKFMVLSIVSLFVILGISITNFDDWKRQTTNKATIDNILEMVVVQGEANSLDVNQIKEAQGQVMSILKTLDGKAVLEEDMIKIVNDVIKSYNQSKLPNSDIQEAN